MGPLRLNLTEAQVAQGGQLLGGQRPDVAVPVGLLAEGQLGDDVVDALPKARVPAGGVLLGDGREVVAEGVACDACVLPAAVAVGFRLEPGILPAVVKQPVRLERQEIVGIALHGREERASRKLDLPEGKRAHGRHRSLCAEAAANPKQSRHQGEGRFQGRRPWHQNAPL